MITEREVKIDALLAKREELHQAMDAEENFHERNEIRKQIFGIEHELAELYREKAS
jgi:hypothetical protein